MRVYLTMDTYPDPEGAAVLVNRVSMQTEPWGANDFPRGKRPRFFTVREADVDADRFAAMLRGELTAEEQDRFHQEAWNQEAGTEEEMWSRP